MPFERARNAGILGTGSLSGTGNIDASGGTQDVTVSELIQIDEVVSVTLGVNDAATETDAVVDSLSVSGNTVTVGVEDGTGSDVSADTLNEIRVVAKGF